MYDAIVIGAGLNGLTTAAYLARGGRKVLVVDRRPAVGGSAATEEIAPGFRVDSCAHDVGWIPPVVARELALASHGLAMLPREMSVFAPECDHPPLTLWADPRKTAASLRASSPRDAERWAEFDTRMATLAGVLEQVYLQPPPNPTSRDAGDLFALARLGLRLRGLGKRDMIEFLRVLPMSASELLDDWFESDKLKGALGGEAVAGVCHGPRSAGTAFVLLHGRVGARSFGGHQRARGGMAAVADALLGAARAAGAEVRLGAEVSRVVVRDGRAAGVVLANGEEVPSRMVASSADPSRTFLQLTGPMHFEPDFVRAVRNVRYRGVAAKVNLALGELPRFRGINGDSTALRGTIAIAPSLDYLERAYDDVKHGGVSRLPYLEATIPSLADDTLAPVGRHVMSIRMQYAPYRLRVGAWTEDRRAALCDLVIDTLGEYAPNLRGAIVEHQVLTPEDIECRYGAPEGNLDHGEMALDQILFMRPVAGWSRYRTPVDGLFLCGAATHPGGRIVGASGRLAAREMLRGGTTR